MYRYVRVCVYENSQNTNKKVHNQTKTKMQTHKY